jgi:AraC-like DNA-binding protein
MNLEYYIPAFPLRPFIKLYAYYNIGKERSVAPIKFLPMGFPYIVFNLRDPFTIYRSDLNRGIKGDGNLIVGQMVHYYHLVPHGTLASFSVIFQPTGLFRLLHVPVHELIDYGYPAEAILSNKLSPLYEQMLTSDTTISQLIRYLDAFFMAQLPSSIHRYGYIEHSLNMIHQTKGLVSMGQLIDVIPASGRTFRRRFLESVGISCKKYIGLKRLNHILNIVKKQDLTDIHWSRLAYGFGYYDQMHFIKSFKQYCGESPTEYVTRYHNPKYSQEQYFLSASE